MTQSRIHLFSITIVLAFLSLGFREVPVPVFDWVTISKESLPFSPGQLLVGWQGSLGAKVSITAEGPVTIGYTLIENKAQLLSGKKVLAWCGQYHVTKTESRCFVQDAGDPAGWVLFIRDARIPSDLDRRTINDVHVTVERWKCVKNCPKTRAFLPN